MGALDWMKYGEPLLTLGSAAVAEPFAGWGGLLSGDPETVEYMRNAMTYQPRTEQGQGALNALANALRSGKETMGDNNPPVNALINGLRAGTDYVGEQSPALGAGLATLPTALMLLGGPTGGVSRGALANALKDGKGALKDTQRAIIQNRNDNIVDRMFDPTPMRSEVSKRGSANLQFQKRP